MKITKSQLRGIIRNTIKESIQEDNNFGKLKKISEGQMMNDDPFGWETSDMSDSEYEDEEDAKAHEYLMELCGQGAVYFQQMVDELESNDYIVSHPEKFEETVKRIKNICKSIDELWM